MSARRASSLRRRLLLGLLTPLLTLVALGGITDYRTGLQVADDAYDYALTSTAIALAARLELDKDHDLDVDLPAAAEAILRADANDQIFFAVTDVHGRLISGDPSLLELAMPPGSANPGFRNVRRGAQPLRVATYHYQGPEGSATIVVAETTLKRQRAARTVLASAIWPNLLMCVATLLIVALGVHIALRPLDELSGELDRRPPDALGPIAEGDTPREARTLVAALNRLMARLQQAAAAQQAFISNAAHQLRTPLAGLQTQLDLALDAPPEQAHARLAAIRAAAARLVHLTQQMLALARAQPEAAASQEWQRLELSALLEEAAGEQLDKAIAQDVDLGFEPAPASVSGSHWLLHEMLANLIDNAIAHTPAGGQVTVRCGLDPAGLGFIEVEDSGPGIADAERAHVTERFYRVPGTRRGGSGLGLAIVRECVERHAGHLDIATAGNGHGARIRVTLPTA